MIKCGRAIKTDSLWKYQ